MLVEPAKQRGYRLSLYCCSSGYDVYVYRNTAPGVPLNDPVYKLVSVTHDELEPAISKVLDILSGGVSKDGEHGIVDVQGKLYQVTKKDDAIYVWTSDEIAEQLSDSVLWEIENKFEEL